MKTRILLLIFALGVMVPQVEAQGLFESLIKAGVNLGVAIKQERQKKSSKDQDISKKNKKSTDEVTLVVSADGATKDEATKVALRSAIEQAYGTFVSANTTLLNDELVKDEIVTVSSGNIKEYKEIASNVMPDGKTFVTLQATVCISKLVSYAQSKGAETEFAGATFAMNIKMKELNKQNEIKAWENMFEQVKEMYKHAFSYNLLISEPQLSNKDNNYCIVGLAVQMVPNNVMQDIKNLIINTAYSLALSMTEYKEYKNANIQVYRTPIIRRDNFDYEPKYYDDIIKLFHGKGYNIVPGFDAPSIPFRSSIPLEEWNIELGKILCNFEIIDNTGTVSRPIWAIYDNKLFAATNDGIGLLSVTANNKTLCEGSTVDAGAEDYIVIPNYIRCVYEITKHDYRGINLFSCDKAKVLATFPILIHKDELNKYSKFEVRACKDPIKITE